MIYPSPSSYSENFLFFPSSSFFSSLWKSSSHLYFVSHNWKLNEDQMQRKRKQSHKKAPCAFLGSSAYPWSTLIKDLLLHPKLPKLQATSVAWWSLKNKTKQMQTHTYTKQHKTQTNKQTKTLWCHYGLDASFTIFLMNQFFFQNLWSSGSVFLWNYVYSV